VAFLLTVHGTLKMGGRPFSVGAAEAAVSLESEIVCVTTSATTRSGV
jgi:hypothetical protein